MKTLFKAIAVASLATATAAQAELSASVAVDSEYVFRGVTVNDEATASATLEYSIVGLTVGAWVADSDNNTADAGEELGEETNLYVSYGLNAGSVDLGVSYTDYSYDLATGGEQEIAVSAAFKGVGLSYTDGSSDSAADYSVITLDYSLTNANILVGQVDSDESNADYSYFAVSGSLGQIAGVEATLTYTGTFDEGTASAANGVESDSIVIGFSKAFDL
ncbi:hypothetical protein N9F42_03050 [Pseudomonadales bacterium]|nr:hypothetical protein [Pseudomonadales bacterium]